MGALPPLRSRRRSSRSPGSTAPSRSSSTAGASPTSTPPRTTPTSPQGFQAARDRLFQIDLWRRRGLGRLAEVFGPASCAGPGAAPVPLPRRHGRRVVVLRDGTREIVSAFVDGVNAYVDWALEAAPDDRLPPEFPPSATTGPLAPRRRRAHPHRTGCSTTPSRSSPGGSPCGTSVPRPRSCARCGTRRPAGRPGPGGAGRPERRGARRLPAGVLPGGLRLRGAGDPGSGATTGSSPGGGRPPDGPCWPTTPTGPSRSRRCATSPTSRRRG